MAPDDKPGQTVSYGIFINFRESNGTHSPQNLTVAEALPYIFSHTDGWYRDKVTNSFSFGVAHTRHEVEDNQRDPAKWVNPLETRLPLAPNLKIYCFYGIGKDTERAYFYREDNDPTSLLNVTIDTSLTQGNIDHGVIMGEGDGTVNLLSSGYMCNKGKKEKRWRKQARESEAKTAMNDGV